MVQQYSFGYWLRLKRKALDLTREGLADRVGCSAAMIRKIEAEERRASAQIVERLADVFEIPKHEINNFLRFARGDWQTAPLDVTEDLPWRAAAHIPPSNIPAPPTAIIGREEEITAVREYLLSADKRLVTLLGPPGIGKTRLSLEVARKSLHQFPDGVFFAGLAPLDVPDLIRPTIAHALGFIKTKRGSATDQLIEGIRNKQMLIILDNLEHLIEEAAPLVSELLIACPHLKILTTSREALRVSGEWLYLVPALSTPTSLELQSLDLETSSQYAALEFFAERARAVRPAFSLNVDNIHTVVDICKQLDGLPLAIELLAARLRWMTPQALLANLGDQFTLHADGMRAQTARQKTLHHAIGWSYNLLTEEEKRLFARLSVFSGGFTQSSAEEFFSVTATHQPAAPLIASLLDKSLLQRTLDAQGEARFNMLVTIRHFALDQLRAWGEETVLRERHLEYFLDLAEKADGEIHGPNQVEWIDRLEVEHDNFQAALEWCVSKQDTAAAVRLLDALSWAWWLRGYHHEVRSWFDKIRAFPDIADFPEAYTRLLNHIGLQSWLLGDYQEANLVLEESQAIGLKMGDSGERSQAETLGWFGMIVLWGENDAQAAQSFFERSLELYQKCGDQRGIAESLFRLGMVADQPASLSLCEQSLDLFRQLGDSWGIARASQLIGQLFLKQGDLKKASEFFEQHLRIDESLQFWQGTVVALSNLGELFRYQGDYAQAVQYYERSLAMCRLYDLTLDESNNYFYQGMTALQQDDYPLARQRFIRAFDLANPIVEKMGACDLLTGLAAVAAGTGQPERAARLSGSAQAILDTISYQFSPFDRSEFDRHLRLAREEIGEAGFEGLFAQGRRMTLEEAVAYALEERVIFSHDPTG